MVILACIVNFLVIYKVCRAKRLPLFKILKYVLRVSFYDAAGVAYVDYTTCYFITLIKYNFFFRPSLILCHIHFTVYRNTSLQAGDASQ